MKRKKFIIKESESESKTKIIIEIEEYEHTSAQESDDVEFSKGESEDSGDDREISIVEMGIMIPYFCQFVQKISLLSCMT